jgi:hypothetical protein
MGVQNLEGDSVTSNRSLSGEWEVPVTRNTQITLVNEGGGLPRDHLW